MRGTILMWSGDKGVVSAEGQRYDFGINEWKGSTAPAANLTVDVVVTNGRLSSATPVNEADLAKEKMAALTGQGGKVAKAVFENVGKDVAIAYGVFLVAALFLNVISAGGIIGISFKLTNLLSDNMGMMGNGKGTFLVLLAAATIAVPYFWKHKFAPLAFLGPLLVTAMAFWPLWEQRQQQQQQMEAMGEFGQMMGQMSEQMGGGGAGIGDLGIGAWVIIAASAYLAFKGVMRFLSRT
jgi:hypothetical protein